MNLRKYLVVSNFTKLLGVGSIAGGSIDFNIDLAEMMCY